MVLAMIRRPCRCYLDFAVDMEKLKAYAEVERRALMVTPLRRWRIWVLRPALWDVWSWNWTRCGSKVIRSRS